MVRVPVTVAGSVLRCGWGLKCGYRLKCGQPYQILERRTASSGSRRKGR